jgi:hypothetical protein
MAIDIVVACVLMPGAWKDLACGFIKHLIHIKANRGLKHRSNDLGDRGRLHELVKARRVRGWKLIDPQGHGDTRGHPVRVCLCELKALLEQGVPVACQDTLQEDRAVTVKIVFFLSGDLSIQSGC